MVTTLKGQILRTAHATPLGPLHGPLAPGQHRWFSDVVQDLVEEFLDEPMCRLNEELGYPPSIAGESRATTLTRVLLHGTADPTPRPLGHVVNGLFVPTGS